MLLKGDFTIKHETSNSKSEEIITAFYECDRKIILYMWSLSACHHFACKALSPQGQSGMFTDVVDIGLLQRG